MTQWSKLGMLAGMLAVWTTITVTGVQPAIPDKIPVETRTAFALSPPDKGAEGDCICALFFIVGEESAIREKCDIWENFSEIRNEERAAAAGGTYSFRSWDDFGTWYPAHRVDRIETIFLGPTPGCGPNDTPVGTFIK